MRRAPNETTAVIDAAGGSVTIGRSSTERSASATEATETANRTVEPTEEEAWALLLSVDGLGPAGFGALLLAHGSGRDILAAARRPQAATTFARIASGADGRTAFGPRVGEGIVDLATDAGHRLGVLRASGLQIVTLDDQRYPARLRAISLPPPVLLVDGDPTVLGSRHAIAVVGTRRPTDRGRLTAARIAAAVARCGAVVVSGLAVGIDGAAHDAVAAEGRPTIAVLGSGHGRLYPRAHATLAADLIAAGGALVSELFPDRSATASTFPQRNRLISGLADATIVVEAGTRSGALITAEWALGQGRDCFFVPGAIDEPRSAGCLRWLRDYPEATRIVAGIPELIEDLGLSAPSGADADGQAPDHGAAAEAGSRREARPRPPSVAAELVELGATARQVAEALCAGHGSIDDLAVATGHRVATILGAITILEVRGLVTSTYGRYRAAGRLAAAVPVGTDRGGTAARPTARRLPARPGPC
jgi:DNA processing protein